MDAHTFRMSTAVALAVCLGVAGCTASEDSEPTSSSTPPPPLGEFAAGECKLSATNTVQADAGEIEVSTLPVFVDYPGEENVHYDDRTGDYLDVPDRVLGEEDDHRLEFARDRALLIMRSSEGSPLSPELLGDVVVSAVEFESHQTYCLDTIPASTGYVGSAQISYSSQPFGLEPDDDDAAKSEVLVWELSADDESLFRDSTPVDDGTTNPDRPDTSVLSAEVGDHQAQLFFRERSLVKLAPPGSPDGRAIKEPAFEILDFYYENLP